MSGETSFHLRKLVEQFEIKVADRITTSLQKTLAQQNKASQTKAEEDYLTIKEVCLLFKISRSQIINLRKKHKDFPVIKIGNCVRYKRGQLEEFFEANYSNK